MRCISIFNVYDFVDPMQSMPNLETKILLGSFLAGQINGIETWIGSMERDQGRRWRFGEWRKSFDAQCQALVHHFAHNLGKTKLYSGHKPMTVIVCVLVFDPESFWNHKVQKQEIDPTNGWMHWRTRRLRGLTCQFHGFPDYSSSILERSFDQEYWNEHWTLNKKPPKLYKSKMK